MRWRSPFQSTKGGGVPFPALTPWANSPGQPSDAGSPMQTTPTPVPKSAIKRGTTVMQKSSLHKASPMDAAPYTPLSARRGVSAQVPDTTVNFVGKLCFTPHIRHQRQHGSSPTSKRSPVASPDQQSASGNKSHAQPPVVSMYAPCRGSNAADQSGVAQQSSKAGVNSTSAQQEICCLVTSKHSLHKRLLIYRLNCFSWHGFICHSCKIYLDTSQAELTIHCNCQKCCCTTTGCHPLSKMFRHPVCTALNPDSTFHVSHL